MIVGGQSTTDDSQDDVSIEQLIRTVETLQAEVKKLKGRQSSVTVDSRK